MNPPRILVIDQDDRLENMIREGLLYYPVEMSFSTTKHEAILKIGKIHPDLIILGEQYKDGNAVELITELKKVGPLVPPGIFIAEENKPDGQQPQHLEIQQQILKLGVVDMIQRPFEMTALHRKIEHAVAVMKTYKVKTRIERFIKSDAASPEFLELLEESRAKGIPMAQLIKLKQLSN